MADELRRILLSDEVIGQVLAEVGPMPFCPDPTDETATPVPFMAWVLCLAAAKLWDRRVGHRGTSEDQAAVTGVPPSRRSFASVRS
ncbi:MAG: hypothetical protein QG622_2904 [Actinomycetota bacterium]|nr:hypothetical protein [Actinomycetota bacterium]